MDLLPILQYQECKTKCFHEMVQECGWKNCAYQRLAIGLFVLNLLAYLLQHQEKYLSSFASD